MHVHSSFKFSICKKQRILFGGAVVVYIVIDKWCGMCAAQIEQKWFRIKVECNTNWTVDSVVAVLFYQMVIVSEIWFLFQSFTSKSSILSKFIFHCNVDLFDLISFHFVSQSLENSIEQKWKKKESSKKFSMKIVGNKRTIKSKWTWA